MFSRVAGAVSGAGAQGTTNSEGESLTSVLETPTLRVELALLVLLCIDSMRTDLVATFDPDKTNEAKPSIATSPLPSATASQNLISFDEPQSEASFAASAARRARQHDIESTQMQALRRSALTFFDKWRAGVMHRICDVLSVRPETVRQAKTKRRQMLAEAEKQRQGISSLIDFDEDPFATPAGSGNKTHGRYNVIETKILALGQPKRVLILHCLLLLLLSLEQYTAHSRLLLLHLASSLELETNLLADHERSVAQGLLATAASQMDAEETAKKQASNEAAARRWKVGLAAVGGAVLIGVTGGLAAPLLAAGLGTVMGGLGLGVVSTYLGALAGSSVLVGSLFGAYGAKMTGRLMDQYAKEVDDFEFVPVQDPDRPSLQRDHEWADELDARDPQKREQHRLRVTIGISGWLSSPSDVNKPWEIIDAGATEPFALRFELAAMLRLGTSLNDVLFSYAWDGLTYTVVSRTLLGALYAGLWPLGLIKVASVLDNPFSVALARADKAGKVLAHALIDGVQGKRPVNLMGYSVGARVIYACLVELAEQHAFGLVESVVLMGSPAPSDSKQWRQIRSVVTARVVNVYSTEDYVLGYLYRSTKLEMEVAGLGEVKDIHGIENVDVSKLVSGHDQYRYLVGTILVKIGFGDVHFDKVEEQQRALELAERKKQSVKDQAKRSEFENNQAVADVPTQTAKPMVATQRQSQPLVDIVDERKSPQSRSTPPPQHRSRAIYTQNNSRQQPAPRKNARVEKPATEKHQPSPINDGQEADPLGTTTLLKTSTLPVKAPSRPMASAFQQRQAPSNLVPTATTETQTQKLAAVPYNYGFGNHDGPISLVDASPSPDEEPRQEQKMMDPLSWGESNRKSPPLEPKDVKYRSVDKRPATSDNLKASTVVTVTEVAVVNADANHSVEDTESEDNASDDLTDETSSDFGELSAVEPIPMDDFDYGLM